VGCARRHREQVGGRYEAGESAVLIDYEQLVGALNQWQADGMARCIRGGGVFGYVS
jgi:hypothetical protein